MIASLVLPQLAILYLPSITVIIAIYFYEAKKHKNCVGPHCRNNRYVPHYACGSSFWATIWEFLCESLFFFDFKFNAGYILWLEPLAPLLFLYKHVLRLRHFFAISKIRKMFGVCKLVDNAMSNLYSLLDCLVKVLKSSQDTHPISDYVLSCRASFITIYVQSIKKRVSGKSTHGIRNYFPLLS